MLTEGQEKTILIFIVVIALVCLVALGAPKLANSSNPMVKGFANLFVIKMPLVVSLDEGDSYDYGKKAKRVFGTEREEITYTVVDTKYATVDDQGVITAKASGTTYILAEYGEECTSSIIQIGGSTENLTDMSRYDIPEE